MYDFLRMNPHTMCNYNSLKERREERGEEREGEREGGEGGDSKGQVNSKGPLFLSPSSRWGYKLEGEDSKRESQVTEPLG